MKDITTCIMNWQAKWIWLVSIVAVVVVNSCVKPNKFGFDDDELQLKFVDTLTTTMFTVLQDTVKTDLLNKTLIGGYNDPVFGDIKAIPYFQLRFPNDKIGGTLGLNPTFISAELILLDPDFYNENQTGYIHKFYMYQLSEEIDVNKTFISDSIAYNTNEDLLKETDRFSLKDDFGKLLYDNITASTQADFDLAIKGVALVPEFSITDAMLTYDLSSDNNTSSNFISITYSFDNEILERDTTTYQLFLDQVGKNGNKISIDRSKTELKTLVKTNDEVVAEKSYVQGITGVKTVISFPTFTSSFDINKNIVFNKIEISIKAEKDESFEIPAILQLEGVDGEGLIDFALLEGDEYVFRDVVQQQLLSYFQFSYDQSINPQLLLSGSSTDIKRAVFNQSSLPIEIKFFYTEFQ